MMMNEVDWLPAEQLDEFAAYAHQVHKTPGVEIVYVNQVQPNADHGVNPELIEDWDNR